MRFRRLLGRRDSRGDDGRRFVKQILADPRAENGKPLDSAAGRRLLEQPGEVLVSALFAALDAAEPDGNSFDMTTLTARDLASQLARRKLPFTADDVDALVRGAAHGSEWLEADRLRIAAAAAEMHAREHGIAAIRKPLREILSWAERDHVTVYRAERTKLRTRVRKLLETAPPEEIDFSLIGADDWGARARRLLERRRRDPAVAALIAHLAGATQASPSQRWREKAVELVGSADAGPLLRELLEEALAAKDGRRRYWGDNYVYEYVSDENATLLRGIVAAAAATNEPWATDVLGRLALHTAAPFRPGYEQRSMKVANACIRALGKLGGDDAVARLTALRTTVKHKSLLKQVESALEQAATAIGITKSQLLERQVPAFDLDADGRRELRLGDVTAIVGTAGLEWRNADGRVLKSPPARLREEHGDELAALRAEAKEIKQRLGVERARIEALLAEERRWPLEEWLRFYRDHPLVGTIARSLLWRFSGDRVALGTDVPEGADEVELWHPLDAAPDDVRRWRRTLVERRIEQPFKQAHREVYLVAPAERETRIYSNRFAAHIVRYRQAYALIKQRGWSVVALGPYDNDGGRQWRDFEQHGIRAHFWMEHVEEEWDDAESLATLAATDQVRFTHIGEDDPLPLDDVPPIVFSEAMRDVDLFVGVASIAADPEWADRGEDRYLDYWRRTAFGELTETATTRREVLADLLPQLAIADRCALEGRFLVVRGDLRTYKIHLGSANVLMEPNDQYLCIVPAGRAPRVFLPFPDDNRLAVILSKAVLLAHDAKIDDPTIVEQLATR